jgi:hypothetical protein
MDEQSDLREKLQSMQRVMLERELDVQTQLDALRAQVNQLLQRGGDVSRPTE